MTIIFMTLWCWFLRHRWAWKENLSVKPVWWREASIRVVTPLWVCGALKRAEQILSGVEVDEADLGHACTRAQRLSVGKCWEHSDYSAVVLVAEGEWEFACLSEQHSHGLVEHEGSVAHLSAVAHHVDGREDWVSRCSVLAGWGPGVDRWLCCGQSEPGSVVGSVCPVQGAFLCTSGSELVAALLVSKRSLLPRVG